MICKQREALSIPPKALYAVFLNEDAKESKSGSLVQCQLTVHTYLHFMLDNLND